MLEEQRSKRENEGKVQSLTEEVTKLKKSRDKLKNKEKADSTRLSALKMKCDHIAAEANELRCDLATVQSKYDKVKELESDIRIVDRVKNLRQCTTDDPTWIQVSSFVKTIIVDFASSKLKNQLLIALECLQRKTLADRKV